MQHRNLQQQLQQVQPGRSTQTSRPVTACSTTASCSTSSASGRALHNSKMRTQRRPEVVCVWCDLGKSRIGTRNGKVLTFARSVSGGRLYPTGGCPGQKGSWW